MFRIIIALIIIFSAVLIYKTLQRRNISRNTLWIMIKNEFLVFKNFREYDPQPRIVLLRKMLYLLTLVFFLLLVFSAYLQILINGGPLTGWFLIIHVTVAPLFAVSLMLTILLWIHKQRFEWQDWFTVRQIMQQKKFSVLQVNHLQFWNKLNFWIFTIASIPAMISIILQLYPVFDSDGMEYLRQVHRYSTLILFVVLIMHGYLLLWMNHNKN
jgi:cytochrome b subunit of formate dehydrogenase